MSQFAVAVALFALTQPAHTVIAVPPVHQPCPDGEAAAIDALRRYLARAGLIGPRDAVDMRAADPSDECLPRGSLAIQGQSASRRIGGD